MANHEVLDDQTEFASASRTVTFQPPPGARAAIFYWDISAVAGTTPIADCKLQYHDATSDSVEDIDDGAFGQKTAADFQILMLGPGLTADTTGDVLAAHAFLGASMKAVFTFDRTTADETYTYTLSVDWIT